MWPLTHVHAPFKLEQRSRHAARISFCLARRVLNHLVSTKRYAFSMPWQSNSMSGPLIFFMALRALSARWKSSSSFPPTSTTTASLRSLTKRV